MSAQATHCARHPDTTTRLLCGKCEAPVCPQCMVHSPVGVRCPQCANVRTLPTFEVTAPYMARAVAGRHHRRAQSGEYLRPCSGRPCSTGLPFLDTIAIVGLGFVVGEIVSLSVNRKRGSTLKLIAAGGDGPSVRHYSLAGRALPEPVPPNRRRHRNLLSHQPVLARRDPAQSEDSPRYGLETRSSALVMTSRTAGFPSRFAARPRPMA